MPGQYVETDYGYNYIYKFSPNVVPTKTTLKGRGGLKSDDPWLLQIKWTQPITQASTWQFSTS
jgi:hypothetical protein